ncbi:AraC family transcriptional regulator [Streptomyces xinghaiensis]|uniref:AraC family transcriptional regulator n=1 Tax=Streptomyces xinghaiensis TaxID=1038928 RepID=A0A3M8EVZ3_9ACTN|nr:AraC family transcriptional regulator [Streptomyces xinghaiensis]PQM19413.1 AraC family transcriptional regulator [Streptomyces xinghaiensis]RKM96129.1 AraC family transcriptional regulator [Streptomyces xinghaiensis]RNC70047.1 AraC family transcriptional regulator [Streptomyces xinghaiensis]
MGDELEAESRLALVADRLRGHLRPRLAAHPPNAGRGVVHTLRELLDERLTDGVSLGEAAKLLHAHPTHLVRAFTAAFGIAPHQYLTARRVERARRLLLDGRPPAEAATASGFYDQPHLTRHFKRILGTTPGRYAPRTAGPKRRRGPRPAAPGGDDTGNGPPDEGWRRPRRWRCRPECAHRETAGPRQKSRLTCCAVLV